MACCKTKHPASPVVQGIDPVGGRRSEDPRGKTGCCRAPCGKGCNVFSRMAIPPSRPFEAALGMTPAAVAAEAEAAKNFPTALPEPKPGQLPQPAFDFILEPNSGSG